MSILPKGWVELQLGEIAKRGGGSIEPSKYPNEIFELYSVPSFSLGNPELLAGYEIGSSKQFVEPGDVLLCKIVPHINRVWKVEPYSGRRQIASGEWIVYREPECSSEYLRLLLTEKSFRTKFLTTVSGVGGSLMRATPRAVNEFYIPISPLSEQKRIVAKVDSLSAKSARAREELARVEKLIARLKQRVLAKAFDSSLDSVSLSFFVTGIKAGKNLKCVERPPYKDEKGVVKVSAVTWGEFDPLESKTLPLDFKPSADTLIRAGDFLFSRANTIELVGAAVIVKTAPDNLYLSDKILRLDFGIDAKAWILYYLRSPQGRHALQDISSGNQLSMRNIGQKSLMQLQVPNADASTRAETVRHIESAFAKIDVIADEARRALDLTDRLDEAILAKAFKGELVPQDPNDEPASALLERIRAGRGVKADTPPALRKPGRPAKAKPSAPVFRESPTPVEKSRIDVAPDHLTQLLTADGHMTSEALWRRSGMSIDEFYKQLRLEINARTIRESDDNRLDAA